MIDAVQLRMARAALRMSTRDLAQLAGVDKNTISRCEGGLRVMSDSMEKLEQALVQLGIVFIGKDEIFGPGIRMRNADPPTRKRSIAPTPKAQRR
jgi:transcriptional regulator with XRE-family HTH domain